MGAMGNTAIKSAQPRVYLDHAATTPVRAEALAAMAEAAATAGNPASIHGRGRAAAGILERARDSVAAWAGTGPERIVFTSGGTEALRLALAVAGCKRRLVLATEHAAVREAPGAADSLPVGADGLIDLATLSAALADGGPALVAVAHANNETGVVQPIAAVAALVAAGDGLLLVDSVQSAGKLRLPDADFVAVSAHKLGGPMGIGALIVRDAAALAGQSGGQEQGIRAGTPNLPGIAGFAAAVALPRPDWAAVGVRRDRLEARLTAARGDAVIHGRAAPRLPNIVSIGLPGVAAMLQVIALDLAGFEVSAGAACSSGKVGPSHVLTAMGLGAAAGEAIRVSLGPETSDAEIDAFVLAWTAMAARLSPARVAAGAAA